MNWLVIKSMVSLKVVATSGIWVFLVPALVRVSVIFSNGEEWFKTSNLNLELASLSLLSLYFSAVSFFLGV